jgi:hypothetical protein
MRRIFLVLAMLALLVLSAMPAMAENGGHNDWGNQGHDDGRWEDDNGRWDDDNWGHHDNDSGRYSYQPCIWYPVGWGWFWNPCVGYWPPPWYW